MQNYKSNLLKSKELEYTITNISGSADTQKMVGICCCAAGTITLTAAIIMAYHGNHDCATLTTVAGIFCTTIGIINIKCSYDTKQKLQPLINRLKQIQTEYNISQTNHTR